MAERATGRRGIAKEKAPRPKEEEEAAQSEGYVKESAEETAEGFVSVPPFGIADDPSVSPSTARGRARAGKGKGDDDKSGKVPSSKSDRAAYAFVLDAVDQIVTARLGPEAALQKGERDLIEPAIAKMMAKLSPQTAKKMASFSEPVMLITGLWMYSQRLTKIYARQQAQRERQQPVQRRPGEPIPIRPETPGTYAHTPAPNGKTYAQTIADALARKPSGPRPGQDTGTGQVDDGLSDAWGNGTEGIDL